MSENKFNLTKRELEITKLLVKGLNNAQIAKELFITCHTVKAHISSIFRKLNVRNRILAAVFAIRKNIV